MLTNTFGSYLKMYITIVVIGIKTNKGTMLLLHIMKKEKSIVALYKVSCCAIVHHLYCFVS